MSAMRRHLHRLHLARRFFWILAGSFISAMYAYRSEMGFVRGRPDWLPLWPVSTRYEPFFVRIRVSHSVFLFGDRTDRIIDLISMEFKLKPWCLFRIL